MRSLKPRILALVGVGALMSLTAFGFVALRDGSQLPSSDMVELNRLMDVEAALQWRDETETLSEVFSDPEDAKRQGYVSMETLAVSPWEHLVKWSIIDDDTILDPRNPEALLYKVEDGVWTLHAVMYFLPLRYNYANTPAIAGDIGTWHTHPTICLKGDPLENPLLGVVDPFCAKGANVPSSLMIHVWVQPNPCGPFAPLLIDDIKLVQEALSGLNESGELQGCDDSLTPLVWPELTAGQDTP